MTYGRETIVRGLQTTQGAMERSILGISLKDRNAEVRRPSKVTDKKQK